MKPDFETTAILPVWEYTPVVGTTLLDVLETTLVAAKTGKYRALEIRLPDPCTLLIGTDEARALAGDDLPTDEEKRICLRKIFLAELSDMTGLFFPSKQERPVDIAYPINEETLEKFWTTPIGKTNLDETLKALQEEYFDHVLFTALPAALQSGDDEIIDSARYILFNNVIDQYSNAQNYFDQPRRERVIAILKASGRMKESDERMIMKAGGGVETAFQAIEEAAAQKGDLIPFSQKYTI